MRREAQGGGGVGADGALHREGAQQCVGFLGVEPVTVFGGGHFQPQGKPEVLGEEVPGADPGALGVARRRGGGAEEGVAAPCPTGGRVGEPGVGAGKVHELGRGEGRAVAGADPVASFHPAPCGSGSR